MQQFTRHSSRDKQTRTRPVLNLPRSLSLRHKKSPTNDNPQVSASVLPQGDAVTRSEASAIDTGDPTERFSNRRLDPFGVTTLYEPKSESVADIVFVHGLGGSSYHTWTKNKDPALFWPAEWLPQEPGFNGVRISTFGYNANFTSDADYKNVLNITDFAKSLLLQLRLSDRAGRSSTIEGKRPIVFVAHSMGGLVVKEAIILGRGDPQFKDVIEAVRGCVFLATPHRGSDLAKTLNRLLSACLFTLSTKNYISDLKSNSQAIQRINEQFRHHVQNIKLASFYETQRTWVVTKKLIVDKDSATLGYPGEISAPLNADHHDVCKFSGRDDPNYSQVLDTLQEMIQQINTPRTELAMLQSDYISSDQLHQDELNKLAKLTYGAEVPVDDLVFFNQKRMKDSCGWLFRDFNFSSWYHDFGRSPTLLWCHGAAGTGKSVATSYVIQRLHDQGRSCLYYFFQFGDQLKNNPTSFLLSIAYQLAIMEPTYRKRLLRVHVDDIAIHRLSPLTVWQRYIVDPLLSFPTPKLYYLIIDGVDECNAISILLGMLTNIFDREIPIHVMIVGRKTSLLDHEVQRLAKSTNASEVSMEASKADLSRYVTDEIQLMHGDVSFKNRTIDRILAKAEGNFLWAHLVMQEISRCHTAGEVEMVLTQVPLGLASFYRQTVYKLTSTLTPAEQELGCLILRWVVCSRHPLTLDELKFALEPFYTGILDMKHTCHRLCGELIDVDVGQRITLIHSSAREFLVSGAAFTYSIREEVSHKMIMIKCLQSLMETVNDKIRNPFNDSQLVFYAATSWPFHLKRCFAQLDSHSLHVLTRFLTEQSLLNWIHFLAIQNHLYLLITTAQALTTIILKPHQLPPEAELPIISFEQSRIFDACGRDLVHLMGKFGVHLSRHPRSIYRLILAFCPEQSFLRHRFASQHLGTIALTQRRYLGWENRLARISIPEGVTALQILILNQVVILVTSDGCIRSFHSYTFEDLGSVDHCERVLSASCDTSSDIVATSGMKETKTWNAQTMDLTCTISNPASVRAIALAFSDGGNSLVSCSSDRLVRRASLLERQPKWTVIGEIKDPSNSDSQHMNSPRYARFTADTSMLAVSFRGLPITVWSVQGSRVRLVTYARNTAVKAPQDHTPSTHGWISAPRICWNPSSGHILSISEAGAVFRWHPLTGDYRAHGSGYWQVECSSDGQSFVTSRKDGQIVLWSFENFTPGCQFSCRESIIDMAVESINHRIYAVSNKSCNVFDASAAALSSSKIGNTSMVLSSDQKLKGKDIAGSSTKAFYHVHAVSALAIDPGGCRCLLGKEDGSTYIQNTTRDEPTHIGTSIMSVEKICFGPKSKCVAVADLSGQVVVRCIKESATDSCDFEAPIIFSRFESTPLRQVLLNPDGSQLLIATDSQLRVCNFQPRCDAVIPITGEQKWFILPAEPDVVLGLAPDSVTMTRWSEPSRVSTFPIDRTLLQSIPDTFSTSSQNKIQSLTPIAAADSTLSVSKVLISRSGTIALVEISHTSLHRIRGKTSFLFDVPTSEQLQHSETLRIRPIPMVLQESCKIAIGFIKPLPTRLKLQAAMSTETGLPPTRSQIWQYSHQTKEDTRKETESQITSASKSHLLVFLDRDHWICTLDLALDEHASVKRYFFLPGDWLDFEALEMMQVSEDGKLFCPRNGEVAVIENGLLEEWVD